MTSAARARRGFRRTMSRRFGRSTKEN